MKYYPTDKDKPTLTRFSSTPSGRTYTVTDKDEKPTEQASSASVHDGYYSLPDKDKTTTTRPISASVTDKTLFPDKDESTKEISSSQSLPDKDYSLPPKDQSSSTSSNSRVSSITKGITASPPQEDSTTTNYTTPTSSTQTGPGKDIYPSKSEAEKISSRLPTRLGTSSFPSTTSYIVGTAVSISAQVPSSRTADQPSSLVSNQTSASNVSTSTTPESSVPSSQVVTVSNGVTLTLSLERPASSSSTIPVNSPVKPGFPTLIYTITVEPFPSGSAPVNSVVGNSTTSGRRIALSESITVPATSSGSLIGTIPPTGKDTSFLSKPETSAAGKSHSSGGIIYPDKPDTILSTPAVTTFPGYGIVPSPTNEASATDKGPFTNTSSSVIPVWTPQMLGNAYGGGFIITPSVYVTQAPFTSVPEAGIPPGYGSSQPENPASGRESPTPPNNAASSGRPSVITYGTNTAGQASEEASKYKTSKPEYGSTPSVTPPGPSQPGFTGPEKDSTKDIITLLLSIDKGQLPTTSESINTLPAVSSKAPGSVITPGSGTDKNQLPSTPTPTGALQVYGPRLPSSNVVPSVIPNSVVTPSISSYIIQSPSSVAPGGDTTAPNTGEVTPQPGSPGLSGLTSQSPENTGGNIGYPMLSIITTLAKSPYEVTSTILINTPIETKAPEASNTPTGAVVNTPSIPNYVSSGVSTFLTVVASDKSNVAITSTVVIETPIVASLPQTDVRPNEATTSVVGIPAVGYPLFASSGEDTPRQTSIAEGYNPSDIISQGTPAQGYTTRFQTADIPIIITNPGAPSSKLDETFTSTEIFTGSPIGILGSESPIVIFDDESPSIIEYPTPFGIATLPNAAYATSQPGQSVTGVTSLPSTTANGVSGGTSEGGREAVVGEGPLALASPVTNAAYPPAGSTVYPSVLDISSLEYLLTKDITSVQIGGSQLSYGVINTPIPTTVVTEASQTPTANGIPTSVSVVSSGPSDTNTAQETALSGYPAIDSVISSIFVGEASGSVSGGPGGPGQTSPPEVGLPNIPESESLSSAVYIPGVSSVVGPAQGETSTTSLNVGGFPQLTPPNLPFSTSQASPTSGFSTAAGTGKSGNASVTLPLRPEALSVYEGNATVVKVAFSTWLVLMVSAWVWL